MQNSIRQSGLVGSSSAFFIAQNFQSALCVLPPSASLSEFATALRYFCKDAEVCIFPNFDAGYERVREDSQIRIERIRTQLTLSSSNKKNLFVITNPVALSQLVVPSKYLSDASIELSRGDWVEREKFLSDLKCLGYVRDELAQDRGVLSVRGHLIDLFSPFEDQPFRIELFGEEIISIRNFDLETQRSLGEVQKIRILPTREFLLRDKEKIQKNLKDFGDEMGISREDREKVLWEIENQTEVSESRWLLPSLGVPLAPLQDQISNLPVILIDEEKSLEESERAWTREDLEYSELNRLAYPPHQLRKKPMGLWEDSSSRIWSALSAKAETQQVLTYEQLRSRLLKSKNFHPLVEEIQKLEKENISPILLFKNQGREKSVLEALGPIGEKLEFQYSEIFSGFSSLSLRKAFITERDIFGTKRSSNTAASSVQAEDFLRQFSDLQLGDYIVHEDHGLGLYRGLVQLEISGVKNEFLLIEYADADKLYLPVFRIDKISRYVRGDGQASPALDRLGSTVFQKRKSKAKDDILRVAHELIQIAAERELVHIERSKIDEDMYASFCGEFPYELTPDQEKCADEIEKDITRSRPMDRLICGDVGFGKTEVALRASMLRLLQGVQVAVLAPTTLLAEQHFKNFKKRYAGFPFRIERLSRFVSAKEQKKVVEDLSKGQVDLIIGTHRLLQNDIQFQNLGLLIVDEEQRFGVKHKERIKKLRSEMDILTLSATPIPRTLQMSIAGIRDLGLIVTPPENREVVTTSVGAFDLKLVRDMSLREIQRGGQVFFVHNRVRTIDKLAADLRRAIPEIKIGIAHGQMKEDDLETVMLKFLDRELDLLLATSIIENGLDIPNANTLFVDHAEDFGLADLYQLRGRVGRGQRKAYAYFLIREETALSEGASKRLQVIQSCTDLGSGFRVATHDLEIRGSGNLLGEAQSGVVAEVGLELYNQLLHESLDEIRQSPEKIELPEMNSGYSAFIPDSYIPDASVRISTYRKISRVGSEREFSDVENEILDRFGLPPTSTQHLLALSKLRLLAGRLRARTFDCYPGRLSFELKEDTPLAPEKIIKKIGREFQLDPKGRIVFKFDSKLLSNTEKDDRFESKELQDFAVCESFLRELCSLIS